MRHVLTKGAFGASTVPSGIVTSAIYVALSTHPPGPLPTMGVGVEVGVFVGASATVADGEGETVSLGTVGDSVGGTMVICDTWVGVAVGSAAPPSVQARLSNSMEINTSGIE